MQISDNEVKKVLEAKHVVEEIVKLGEARTQAEDQELIASTTQAVMAMSDREDRIAELKARIEAGTYNPTGDEIADTMIRRSIADRMR